MPTKGQTLWYSTYYILYNWPVKGLCSRCLSVWGPEPHTPPFTHCMRVYCILIHTGKGGGVLYQREGERGQQFTKPGRKYQYEYLYLQSINSDKHLPQSYYYPAIKELKPFFINLHKKFGNWARGRVGSVHTCIVLVPPLFWLYSTISLCTGWQRYFRNTFNASPSHKKSTFLLII